MTRTITACFFLTATACLAGLSAGAEDDNLKSPIASSEEGELFKKFEETLNKATLVGQFTIIGKNTGDLPDEEYTIKSVKKLPDGDYWLFQARIKYGDKDVTVPLPLEVKWAGDTPIITLTNFTIPVLGTFSSRVIIYNNKYAGTWTHGKVGGHLFGTIGRTEEIGERQ